MCNILSVYDFMLLFCLTNTILSPILDKSKFLFQFGMFGNPYIPLKYSIINPIPVNSEFKTFINILEV